MATNKLNAKFCETAKPGNHFDGEGLYLLVEKNGKKYWRHATSFQGKQKLIACGTYPKVSLAEARAERQHNEELIAAGIDPVQYKKEQKLGKIKVLQKEAYDRGSTFEQIARRLIANKEETKKATQEYCYKMLRLFEIHVFPRIGHKDIADIKGAELLALFNEVAQKKNHDRPMTYLAKTLCQRCGEVFDFAHLENHDFTSNPCRVVIKHLPNHEVQHMRRIEVKLLPDFIKDLLNYNGHELTKAAMWIMLYTAVRTISIRRAQRQDVNLKEQIWMRQPEKRKKKPFPIPLPRQAVEVIKSIDGYIGNKATDLLFPSVHDKDHPMSEAAICQAIKRMGKGYDMVGHGIRGFVDTCLNDLGYPPHIVDAQLEHTKKKSKVELAYNMSTYYDERFKMMQEWADLLNQYIEQAKKTPENQAEG